MRDRPGPDLAVKVAARAPVGDLGRGLAVTLLLLLAVALLGRVPLPGLRSEPLAGGPTSAPTPLGLLAVGLGPLFTAFCLVELLALAVPRWRSLRTSGYATRGRLWSLALWLGLAFAASQGHATASQVQGALPGQPPPAQVAGEDPGTRLYLAGAFVAGTLVLAGLARVIGRRGVGNGFSVLMVALLAPVLVRSAVTTSRHLAAGDLRPLPLALTALTALLVAGMVRGPRPPREAAAPLRLVGLACGLVPVTVASGLLLLPTSLANLGLDLSGINERVVPGSCGYRTVQAALVAGLCPVFCWLFNHPRLVADLWRRDASTAGDPRSALRRATLRGLGSLVLLVVIAGEASGGAAGALDLPSLAVLVAVAMDLAGEIRFRLANGRLVAVWPLHRLYAVDLVLRALQRGGTPAYPRGLCHRTLWHFFAPFVPVEILVPESHGERAETALRALLCPGGPTHRRLPSGPCAVAGEGAEGRPGPDDAPPRAAQHGGPQA